MACRESLCTPRGEACRETIAPDPAARIGGGEGCQEILLEASLTGSSSQADPVESYENRVLGIVMDETKGPAVKLHFRQLPQDVLLFGSRLCQLISDASAEIAEIGSELFELVNGIGLLGLMKGVGFQPF